MKELTYNYKIDFFNLFLDFTKNNEKRANILFDLLKNKFTYYNDFFENKLVYEKIFNYLNSVIEHKKYVYSEGINLISKLNNLNENEINLLKYNLFIHDLSKFSVNESIAYCYYFGEHEDKNHKEFKKHFNIAWNHHKKNNKHHPEYWISVNKKGKSEFLDMPYIYVIEMVCDWLGAGKTYGNTMEEYLKKELHNFYFSKKTGELLYDVLSEINILTKMHFIKENIIYLKTI